MEREKGERISIILALMFVLFLLPTNGNAILRIDDVQPKAGELGQPLESTLTGAGFNANTKVAIEIDTTNRHFIIGAIETPGMANDVAVISDKAYVADGETGLQIIDISNPQNPQIIGTIDTPGNAREVDVANNIAIVADEWSGLQLIDVTNPQNPQIVGTVDTPGSANDVYVVNTKAYVADGDQGLQVVDFLNPQNPQILGAVDTPGWAVDVYVVDNKAYVADQQSGLQVIDVSNPYFPQIIGSVDVVGRTPSHFFGFWGVSVSGDTAYVIDPDFGLQVVDVSNPYDPQIVGVVSDVRLASEIKTYGDIALVGGTYHGLQIIDTKDPHHPIVIGSTGTHGAAGSVALANDTAVVTDTNGLTIIDINNPQPIKVLGAIETSGATWGLSIVESTAYVTDTVSGLQVIDITDVKNPIVVGSVPTGSPRELAVVGDRAYVANSVIGLEIIDISDPQNPAIMGSVDTGGSLSVSVVGDKAYVLNYGWGSFQIIDISNPQNPQVVGTVDTPSYAYDITFVGDTAYVADGDQGLLIIDVSNPQSPQVLGSVDIDVPEWRFGFKHVTVAGTTAFVLDNDYGLQVIDVSNPQAPTIVGSITDIEATGRIAVTGNRAFIAGPGLDLVAIDIQNLQNPKIIGQTGIVSNVLDVEIVGDKAFIAGSTGFFIVPLPAESTPVIIPDENTIEITIPSLEWMGYYNVAVSNEDGIDRFIGAFVVSDSTPPTLPSDLSSSQDITVWLTDNTVDLNWIAGADPGGSDVAGYSYEWSTSTDTEPDSIVDQADTFLNDQQLPDGDQNWFHLRTIDNEGNASQTASLGPFRIDTLAPVTAAIPSGGGFTSPQSVTLSCNDSPAGSGCSTIHFTTDGIEPDESSPVYSDPIDVTTNTTLKFYGEDLTGNIEGVKTEFYVIDTDIPNVAITIPADGSSMKPLYYIEGTASDAGSGLSSVQLLISDGQQYFVPGQPPSPSPTWVDAASEDGFQTWNLYAQDIWEDGLTYTITARSIDSVGNTSTDTAGFSYQFPRFSSTISCIPSDSDIVLGGPLQVTGQISPNPDEGGAFVDIEFKPAVGESVYKTVLANSQGEFSYDVECGVITRDGAWSVKASWQGDDTLESATSYYNEFQVVKADSRITLHVTSQAIKFGESVSISGKFTPQPDCGGGLAGIPITLIITGPSGIPEIHIVQTDDQWGHFVLQNYDDLDELGDWNITASLSGNSAFESAISDPLPLKVLETAGYAIIVQGKISNEEGLASHNKTTQLVYKKLKDRGLLDTDIQYFNYDTGQTGVDGLPTKANVQEAITQWARDKMNATPANLYLIMVDHGLVDVFYIHPETISSSELATWIDTLQNGLTGQAAAQEVINILGFCRSGSFIDDLSGPHRVIIASAAANESSYKGPLDDDGIRDGEYFVSEFFKGISLGKSIRESFQSATALTKVFTAHGGSANSNNAPYFDASLQHPLLDDNADGSGSNDLASETLDGVLSEDLFIGVSSVTGNDPGDVVITKLTETRFLTAVDTTVDLWARVDDNSRLRTIWCEVKPPGYNPVDPGGSGQAEMDLVKTLGIYNGTENRYEWNALGGFSEAGTYQVFYFAKDDITGNVSPLAQSIVYKASGTNTQPDALSLALPAGDATTLTTTILDWTDTIDPDGDYFSYTVLLSKDDPQFTDPLRIERIESSSYLVSPADGIEDLSTYYWKVQAIDDYGAIAESETRQLNTNNTNPVAAYFIGFVFDSGSGQLLPNASININNTAIQTDSSGYYLGVLDPGLYDVSLSAPGYDTQLLEDVIYADGDIVRMDIGLVPMLTGNMDGNETVNLVDAIIALQVLSGINENGLLRSDYIGSGADVNGDETVGMAELVYILQFVSGVKDP